LPFRGVGHKVEKDQDAQEDLASETQSHVKHDVQPLCFSDLKLLELVPGNGLLLNHIHVFTLLVVVVLLIVLD
jgi:hypothetical protein